jgi:hypothetical protein
MTERTAAAPTFVCCNPLCRSTFDEMHLLSSHYDASPHCFSHANAPVSTADFSMVWTWTQEKHDSAVAVLNRLPVFDGYGEEEECYWFAPLIADDTTLPRTDHPVTHPASTTFPQEFPAPDDDHSVDAPPDADSDDKPAVIDSDDDPPKTRRYNLSSNASVAANSWGTGGDATSLAST